MSAGPVQITSGLQALVEQLEAMPPDELATAWDEIAERVGSVRHLTLAALLSAARNLDWAPHDASGALDLTAGSVLHVETLLDRIPAEERLTRVRTFNLAVAHRLHERHENAPFVLPEIAADAERARDPRAAQLAMAEALRDGAVTQALHAWPCCSARMPWSQIVELVAEFALADGATCGGRVIVASGVRRFLEIAGREHRHPVITALWRGLAAAPCGVAPATQLAESLELIADADEPRDPGAGDRPDATELASTLCAADRPVAARVSAAIVSGVALGSIMDALALVAADHVLRLDAEHVSLRGWVSDGLVFVNAMRDIDGREDRQLRPRVVVQAAHVLAARLAHADVNGATWGAKLPVVSSGVATLDAFREALAAGDAAACSTQAAALASSPRQGVHVARLLDSMAEFDPADLSPLRLHVAAVDEYRRVDGAHAGRFLAASARTLASR